MLVEPESIRDADLDSSATRVTDFSVDIDLVLGTDWSQRDSAAISALFGREANTEEYEPGELSSTITIPADRDSDEVLLTDRAARVLAALHRESDGNLTVEREFSTSGFGHRTYLITLDSEPAILKLSTGVLGQDGDDFKDGSLTLGMGERELQFLDPNIKGTPDVLGIFREANGTVAGLLKEYIPGSNVDDLMKDFQQLPAEQAEEETYKVYAAVKELVTKLGEQGISAWDYKGANIQITTDPAGEYQAVFIDPSKLFKTNGEDHALGSGETDLQKESVMFAKMIIEASCTESYLQTPPRYLEFDNLIDKLDDFVEREDLLVALAGFVSNAKKEGIDPEEVDLRNLGVNTDKELLVALTHDDPRAVIHTPRGAAGVVTAEDLEVAQRIMDRLSAETTE